MADTAVTVTTSPTAIPGLAEGSSYVAQALGHQPITYTTITGSTYNGSSGFVAKPGSAFAMKPDTGETVFVWVTRGTGVMVYTESA